MKPSPNLLLIVSDQQRFDALGCNHNPIVQTPNLDAFANSAANLTHHSCSSPLCTPARASLLTGQYARSHGAFHVGYTLPPTTPTLATRLAQAGYACGLFGKSHLEPEMSNFQTSLDQNAPYYGFTQNALSEDNLVGPYIDWITREHPQHLAAAWQQANEDCQPDLARRWLNRQRTHLDEAHTLPLPLELTQSAWITRQAQTFIRQQTAAQKPFFAMTCYTPPHHPWIVPEPYASMYDPRQIPLPPRFPTDHPWPFPLSAYNHLPNLPDSEMQRAIALYYALCTMLDDFIGQLLKTLADTGNDRDTIVVFTSDHGDYNGDFGLLRKGGPPLNCLLHTPLLLRVPGTTDTPQSHNFLTQHEDLAPTLLELLNLPQHSSIQGKSFAHSLTENGSAPRSHAFIDLFHPRVTGVYDGTHKLLHYPDHELLTLPETDPAESQNLVPHPAHQFAYDSLSHALYRWLLATPPHLPAKQFPW